MADNTQDKPIFTVGTSTLSGGTTTVSNPLVTANSLIFLTPTKSGIVNLGSLTISAKVAGVSFSVTSNNILDSAPFNYMIIG